MEESVSAQGILDDEHLRLLRIGYFISAAANCLWVLFPLIYVGMGAMLYSGGFDGPRTSDGPPRSIGLFFMAIGGALSLAMAAITTLKVLAARAIGERRSRTLILVTAGICCLGVPWGTTLGVFTFLVMSRPTVTSRFSSSA